MTTHVRKTVDTRGTLAPRFAPPERGVIVTVPVEELRAEVERTAAWRERAVAATLLAALGWGLWVAGRI